MPSLKEELDKEVAAYRQKVGNGLNLHERIIELDRLIDNYKPMGLNVVDLETERSRLILEEKQQQLRASESQSKATQFYNKGVGEYRDGQYQFSLETFRNAERLIPQDNSIKVIRRKLEAINPITEAELGESLDSRLFRLAVTHFLENDPKRSLNTLIYASDKKIERVEFSRLMRLVENEHPEVDTPRVPSGITLVEHKLQVSLESIYEGRYLTAISECTDVLDLEPENVLALTRLGSAYFAMNEREKAKQIWTKALQLEPNNDSLRKFLYGTKTGGIRVP
ncbi:MAG: tetratricopeptide repeat protein [Elusimicrobiota bacterium]